MPKHCAGFGGPRAPGSIPAWATGLGSETKTVRAESPAHPETIFGIHSNAVIPARFSIRGLDRNAGGISSEPCVDTPKALYLPAQRLVRDSGPTLGNPQMRPTLKELNYPVL